MSTRQKKNRGGARVATMRGADDDADDAEDADGNAKWKTVVERKKE
jgi:hypothetical protein